VGAVGVEEAVGDVGGPGGESEGDGEPEGKVDLGGPGEGEGPGDGYGWGVETCQMPHAGEVPDAQWGRGVGL